MQQNNPFSVDFLTNANNMDAQMRLHESFDLLVREIKGGSKRIRIYFVNGAIKDVVMLNVLAELMKLTDEKLAPVQSTRAFADLFLPYVEADVCNDRRAFEKAVFSGQVGVLAEGFPEAVLLDVRVFPSRPVSEPENDKVLRGAHEGFVETLICNTALIRRRVRDANLTMSLHQIGSRSKTDVAVCYLHGRAEEKVVRALAEKLAAIDASSLTMGQESLLELLIPGQWYNPFPKVRYTERPDSAAACILEGSVIVLVDNSPVAMIIPTGFFDFLQDTNDFFFPPFIGTFLRMIRMMVFALTVFLTPAWFLAMQYEQYIPPWLDFIKVYDNLALPLVFQLLIIELVIDVLKSASLNTPNALSSSFSVIGALVLGQFAVQAGFFNTEAVLYMAFVAIANFAQPSFELGYAFKISRMLIITLTAIFHFWGFVAGTLLFFLVLSTTKTISGRCYLYPLLPFNGKQLLRRLVRMPIGKDNS